jgi:hypothetical protein
MTDTLYLIIFIAIIVVLIPIDIVMSKSIRYLKKFNGNKILTSFKNLFKF